MTGVEQDPRQLRYRDSLEGVETDSLLTGLNILTASRAVGGAALGYAMATEAVTPLQALAANTVLLATDAEKSLWLRTRRFERFQQIFRIMPSKAGAVLDPIADKAWILSQIAGGMRGDMLSAQDMLPILATEIGTAATSGYVQHVNGEPPKVGMLNKAGLVGRALTLGLNLAAASSRDKSSPLHKWHNTLVTAGHVTSVASTGLGLASMWNIFKQRKPKTS